MYNTYKYYYYKTFCFHLQTLTIMVLQDQWDYIIIAPMSIPFFIIACSLSFSLIKKLREFKDDSQKDRLFRKICILSIVSLISYTLSTLLIGGGFSYVYFTEDFGIGLILYAFLFITFLTGRATFYILLIIRLSQMYTKISLTHCTLIVLALSSSMLFISWMILSRGIIGAVLFGSYAIIDLALIISILILFTRKLYRVVKISTNKQDFLLATITRYTVLSTVAISTDIIAQMMIVSNLIIFTYLDNNSIWGNTNNIMVYFVLLMDMNINCLCIWLTFKFNETAYFKICMHLHNCCLKVAQQRSTQPNSVTPSTKENSVYETRTNSVKMDHDMIEQSEMTKTVVSVLENEYKV